MQLDVDRSSHLISDSGTDSTGAWGRVGEMPGLDSLDQDAELYASFGKRDALAAGKSKPAYLAFIPTWFPPCCLVLSIIGVLFLVRACMLMCARCASTRLCVCVQALLSGLLASDYPYVRLSGSKAQAASDTMTAAIIYAVLALLSFGCLVAHSKPAVVETRPMTSLGKFRGSD
jgi:hypothetical protein